MSTELESRIIAVRNSLLNNMTIAKERANKGRANDGQLQKYQTRLEEVNKNILEATACGNHMRDIYKNIKSYAQEHQRNARNMLDLAIAAAGDLVPDAGSNGVHLKAEANNRITIVSENGQNINLREGCGYRAILGALIRYAAIKAQPDAFQFILFDEYFFTLSDVTTYAVKSVMSAMSKDMTIICIEQRRNVADGILNAEYVFKKDENGNTEVTRVL